MKTHRHTHTFLTLESPHQCALREQVETGHAAWAPARSAARTLLLLPPREHRQRLSARDHIPTLSPLLSLAVVFALQLISFYRLFDRQTGDVFLSVPWGAERMSNNVRSWSLSSRSPVCWPWVLVLCYSFSKPSSNSIALGEGGLLIFPRTEPTVYNYMHSSRTLLRVFLTSTTSKWINFMKVWI